jgi:hypothetical protein
VGLPNDQSDIDVDGLGDACDPVDDRPVDTGDTATDTAADTAADTGTDTSVAVDTSEDTGDTPNDHNDGDAVKGKYVPGGCSTTGGGGSGGMIIIIAGALLASRRRGLLPLLLGIPFLMGASGGEVPEMSVVPLPPRGDSHFIGDESSIVGGVVTDPLSYVDRNGDEVIVIGDTFWGWTTNRYTFDHLSVDFGLPASIADDGVVRVGDAWGGLRLSSKTFGEDGLGAYGDVVLVVPTGTGRGVSHPGAAAGLEAGGELQRGDLGLAAGAGLLVYPTVDLEGYELGSGPYITAAGTYGVGGFTVGLDSQVFHNVGEQPISSLFVGSSLEWTAGNFSMGAAVSKGIIRQPGDPGWQAMVQLTFGPDDEEPVPAPVPAALPPPPTCDCKSITVMEQPIVIVVPEKPDVAQPPKQEIGIGFKSGDSTLSQRGKATLDGVWVILNARPGFGIKVVGYADSSEAEIKHPEDLSSERAQVAAKYLIEKGIAESRVKIEGAGDTNPLDTSGTPEGRALNRRVEFIVTVAAETVK